jgi:hypothetical protein
MQSCGTGFLTWSEEIRIPVIRPSGNRGFEIQQNLISAFHWRQVFSPSQPMFNLDPYSILAGFIFSTIGMGSFAYGKKLELWQPRVIGLALMGYPYFIYNAWLLWGIGLTLLTLLWFYHHE